MPPSQLRDANDTLTAGAPSVETNAVEIVGLRVILGEQVALRGVNLSVRAGICVALVGPNGAGKSTLLRALAGLVRPESGHVSLDGRPLASDPWYARRAIGFVGHQPMLYPELTAAENLRFYGRLYGLDRLNERVRAGLTQVQLLDRADSRADTLSRGMMQRLALARALLHEPSILLLDEAESGLDATATDLLLGILHAQAGQRTVILASHDLGFVQAAADEVVILRNGRVIERLMLADGSRARLHERYADVLARPTTRGPATSGARPGAALTNAAASAQTTESADRS
jgi:heme exporter protein A